MRLLEAPEAGQPVRLINHKPVFVLDDLANLQGPAAGSVTLPLRLDWTPANNYDLSILPRVATMYATVLREATREEDLIAYLNRDLLIKVWSGLNLPKFIRTAWQEAHPELTTC